MKDAKLNQWYLNSDGDYVRVKSNSKSFKYDIVTSKKCYTNCESNEERFTFLREVSDKEVLDHVMTLHG